MAHETEADTLGGISEATVSGSDGLNSDSTTDGKAILKSIDKNPHFVSA